MVSEEIINREIIKSRPERERAPVYTCVTIKFENPRIKAVYDRAMGEILGGKRVTNLGYMDGMEIHSQDLTKQEKAEILQATARLFSAKGVNYESCYVDICGKDRVNYGLYFADDDELEKTRQAFRDDLKISFTADLQINGRYKERKKDSLGVGHNTGEPHLKRDGTLVK